MKHHIVRTMALAFLSLGLAAAASAKDHHTCSIANVAGDWGYSLQGTFFLPSNPTVPVPVAFVGMFNVDPTGNLLGTQISNVGGNVPRDPGGNVVPDVLKGTLTVNPDCTGTQKVEIYDPSGALLRTAVWAVVFLDDAKEVRGTFESLTTASGTNVPAIAIANGRRQFRNPGQEK